MYLLFLRLHFDKSSHYLYYGNVENEYDFVRWVKYFKKYKYFLKLFVEGSKIRICNKFVNVYYYFSKNEIITFCCECETNIFTCKDFYEF